MYTRIFIGRFKLLGTLSHIVLSLQCTIVTYFPNLPGERFHNESTICSGVNDHSFFNLPSSEKICVCGKLVIRFDFPLFQPDLNN